MNPLKWFLAHLRAGRVITFMLLTFRWFVWTLLAIEIKGSSDTDLGHAVGGAYRISNWSIWHGIIRLSCQSLLEWCHLTMNWSPFRIGRSQRTASIRFIPSRFFGRFIIILRVIWAASWSNSSFRWRWLSCRRWLWERIFVINHSAFLIILVRFFPLSRLSLTI